MTVIAPPTSRPPITCEAQHVGSRGHPGDESGELGQADGGRGCCEGVSVGVSFPSAANRARVGGVSSADRDADHARSCNDRR